MEGETHAKNQQKASHGDFISTPPPPSMDYSLELYHGGSNQQQQQMPAAATTTTIQTAVSLDKLMCFADVMQFADLGPKLALSRPAEEEAGYFLRFPVLSGCRSPPQEEEDVVVSVGGGNQQQQKQYSSVQEVEKRAAEGKSRKKRPRSVKSSEEVESQRMTHIAVERNRRKQMNEHLRVLRSLMPGSYVQRGDQASIIGGAIEFVRELEQLLQCLESQKRRRLFGAEAPPFAQQPQQQQPFFAPSLMLPPPPPPGGEDLLEFDLSSAAATSTGGTLREDTAENKSCVADVEVRVLGYDAAIKILSRRRPEQLLKTIAALEDLQLDILHTNITTVEQTVLYSFNVKIVGETRLFTAEEIANSVQQIFSFIEASTL